MTRAVHWFRNDLRLRDNRALRLAASAADELVPLFVLDATLLRAETTGPPRVRFLIDCLARLDADLRARGGRGLVVRRGDPRKVVPAVVEESGASLLSFGRDATPYARPRDEAVRRAVERAGAEVRTAKDRVVFEASELRTQEGRAYRVYTPYRNAWRARLERDPQPAERAPRLPPVAPGIASDGVPEARALGFADDGTEVPTGGEAAARRRLRAFLDDGVVHYRRDRDRPAVDGTSRLSPYLRLGAISARECVEAAGARAAADRRAARGAWAWIDELVWRDFYAAVLAETPGLRRESLREEFRDLRWDDDDEAFRAWCEGRTGYPFVDAGMRQLRATGWMHNRVRMVVAMFLTKDLLLDWRRGERFFLRRLVDGDPASNAGGWQWSASTGTDAAPYFRILNPVTQGRRYDPEGEYVRRFVPELRELPQRFVHEPWKAPQPPADYPLPIVDHAERRREALRRFERARS